jgi:photosystem II stability/assembly factor-like uncharacterized protein
MGAKVTFKIITNDKLSSLPVVDGQLIFVEDKGKIYLDYHNGRKCYTPDGGSSTGGLNYIGIMDEGFKPADSTTWKIGGELIVPNEKDVVVYGKKEYMWRKD